MLENQNIFREKENHRVFKQLLNTFIESENKTQTTEENVSKNIRIVPKFFYDQFNKQLKVEFRIGDKQLYKLKNLPEFYEKMLNNEAYQYGARLNFIHSIEAFEEESRSILSFLLKYAEIIKYSNEITNNYTYYRGNFIPDNILLSNTGLDDIFEILKDKNVLFQINSVEKTIHFSNEEPKIIFNITELEDNKFKLKSNIDVFEYDILKGREYIYLLFPQTLYRCTKEFEDSTLKILEVLRKNYTNQIIMDEKELTNFFAMIAPKIEEKVSTSSLSKEKKEKYIPQKLGTKIYLDYDQNNNIIADIKFCYGKQEFNPLINQNISIARNIIKENEALNQFIQTGFMLDKNNARLILVDENKIYKFLSEEIEDYMKKYEVLATDNFKKKEIHSLKMNSVGVKIENNLLQIDLSQIDVDLSDLPEIMEKYKLKKTFHRLKDGSYIELKQNDTLKFLDNLNIDSEGKYTNLKGGVITLQNYRGLYLQRCLEELKNVEIKEDTSYKKMINNLQKSSNNAKIELPKNLNANLRTYQKIGYQWLKTLDQYGFGGILADDMGLGKTIQILAVILDYVNKNKENKNPSLVVCPSSLTLNWLNEANKFAPSLKVSVISGSAIERARKIAKIEQFDLIITSYDSLKRDIEIYEEKAFLFRYMIADEAQYIKNNNTQNAKVIKKILTKTRFALTGTPIENSLSELWSIFDYIMPGYLFKYRKFKELYETPIVKGEDEDCLERLKKMIEPFVLRRIKKDVLTELPDKTVSVLYNEMQDEQQKVYLSYLATAKKEITDEIKINGLENSQIKILALLMRLRQICCHPNLFLQDYDGESSKLLQCIELIKNTVESGHKILLFSGYTSMLEKIEKELKLNKISYLKLTGQTKVSERIELVDKFNEDKELKVFLISLKAGGTGLNLTGADVVIHYDPWWNLSAENQATDRTYRIGQKNNVQVYKLITKNSIEEKIYELQQKKAKLADDMLSTKNTFINQLSKEDIMKLFG
ncbi:MAG: DEAD/DEAH box helicase [Clostridia bacterium]